MVKRGDDASRRLPVTPYLIRAITNDAPEADEQYIIYDSEGKERDVIVKTATNSCMTVVVPAFLGSRLATAIHTHPASEVTVNTKKVLLASPFPSTSDLIKTMGYGLGGLIVLSRVSENEAYCSYITDFPTDWEQAQKLSNKYEGIRQTITEKLKEVAKTNPAGSFILTIAAANTTLRKMAEQYNLSYGLYHVFIGDVNIVVRSATIEDMVRGVHEP